LRALEDDGRLLAMTVRYRVLAGPIRQFLRDRDIEAQDFARRIDVNPQHFSRVLNGKTPLTFDMAARIANGLGVDLLAVMEPVEPNADAQPVSS
jgi:plasmid maintenance system antidote protein VapI